MVETEWLPSVVKIRTLMAVHGAVTVVGWLSRFRSRRRLTYPYGFRYNRKFKAKNGEKGMTKGMHGRGAEDLIVSIRLGTTVRDAETGKGYH